LGIEPVKLYVLLLRQKMFSGLKFQLRSLCYYPRILNLQISSYSPEGRRPLGRPMGRWKDNIKTDLREVGWGLELDQSGSG
jgi:hypothetical protein